MTRYKKGSLIIFIAMTTLLFLLSSCSNLPLIGKKKEQVNKLPDAKTVTIEGMENIKGANPPRTENPPSKKPPVPATPKQETETKVASIPTRPFQSSSLPFFQLGFKRKVVILDFENQTTYKDEKIGETAAKRLSDKLEATQKVVILNGTDISRVFRSSGFKFESLTDLLLMKHAYQALGIQAFASGTVTDVSILSSKKSETSDEEVTFATAKIEIRLIDASTGNLLKSFIGRSPIFGTKETGEYSRSKAVLKAIDLSLEEIFEGFLHQLDFLDWATTVAKIDGDNLYINAGKLSGLRIGDTLEIFEPGKEIIHPVTKFSLGWTTGQLKGRIKITELFGVDAAIGKVVQGNGFSPNDVVKSTMR
jgi:PBP1b-binding outer membrane lipoprotein LpoB